MSVMRGGGLSRREQEEQTPVRVPQPRAEAQPSSPLCVVHDFTWCGRHSICIRGHGVHGDVSGSGCWLRLLRRSRLNRCEEGGLDGEVAFLRQRQQQQSRAAYQCEHVARTERHGDNDSEEPRRKRGRGSEVKEQAGSGSSKRAEAEQARQQREKRCHPVTTRPLRNSSAKHRQTGLNHYTQVSTIVSDQ